MAVTMYDGEQVYAADLNLAGDEQEPRIQVDKVKNSFKLFITAWHQDNRFPYREQLISNATRRYPCFEVDLEDLTAFDAALAQQLRQQPTDLLPILEEATGEAYRSMVADPNSDFSFQLTFISREKPKTIREVHADLVGKLVVIPGLIVSCSRPVLKAVVLKAQCKGCQAVLSIPIESGLSGCRLPRVCTAVRQTQQPAGEKCPMDPYVILADSCEFVDLQTMRLQETPETIPTGEMPRNFTVTVERHLVDKVAPGSRITLIGIFGINTRGLEKSQTLRQGYIRSIGIMTEKTYSSRFSALYTAEDEERFLNYGRDPTIYERVGKSIASAIFGNEDIKKALACLLFGGSRKALPDGMRLRGDINVLLIGDPSTAKSQLLKFVERVAPISVYTSGKGSSAAGLTASVIKDPSSGEFQLEGGAMVLADGGVVCIDEFDKMRSQDRVAIHEAMEQQTISIAKAGITTILNSRTSVLAAANPSKGSYDDFMEASEQIELQNTILSRFDCIFLVRDIRDEKHDKLLANHVIQLHRGGAMEVEEEGEISLADLKQYIAYARAKCFPRLTPEAGARLQNYYVADRAKIHKDKNAFPITVRQLEALIRLSEAIAKISLCSQVTLSHVEEAHRLFQVSTLDAATQSLSTSGSSVPQHKAELVKKVEEEIRKKIAIGSKMSRAKLEEYLVFRFSDLQAANFAIFNLVKREEIELRDGTKIVVRLR